MRGEEVVIDKEKSCFIITPIGDINSEVFRKAKGVIESVIKPILEENGYADIKPAYEINNSGMISTQIINRIIDDDLVVVNLTGNNPNVMYELCLRHVVAKPVIHICEEGTDLPFDIKDNRTIFYKDDMLGVDELKEKFFEFLSCIEYEKVNNDNPVYNAYKSGKLLKEFEESNDNSLEGELLIDLYNMVLEMRSEKKAAENRDTHQYEYSVAEFMEDIKKIDKTSLDQLKNMKCKIRVHELAKELGIKNATIIYIARLTGSNLQGHSSSINKAQLSKILEYIERYG